MNFKKVSVAFLLILALGFVSSAKESAESKDVKSSGNPNLFSPVHGPKPKPIDPPQEKEIKDAISKGIKFLLKSQNKNGSWGSARRTKGLNIYAPVPGAHHAFRGAVTSLCLMALLEVRETVDEKKHKELDKSILRGEKWIHENLPRVKRANPSAIYNNWCHSYAIQAMVRLLKWKRPDLSDSEAEKRNEALLKLIDGQIERMDRYSSIDGGWGYYDFRARTRKPSSSSSCFLSGTALIALAEARDIGRKIPEKLTKKAVKSIQRQRKKDFSYLYGEYMRVWPMYDINRKPGSLGRSQVCNAALRLWGDTAVTNDIMKAWLNRLYARNEWLGIGRKRPIPHESWFAVAGYFYYYGHFYAAFCIDQLKPEDKPYFQDHLAFIVLKLQEKDGSWWDFPFYDYHQQYGTAMTLTVLRKCMKTKLPKKK